MRAFQNASIQRKQMLIIMLASSVALLVACAAFTAYEVITFRKTMVRNLSTLAKIIGNNTSAALDFSDAKSAEETLAALIAEPNIVSACIFTKAGQVFAKYDRADDEKLFASPLFRTEGQAFGERELTVYRPILYKGERIGVVYLASDMQALYDRLAQYAAIVAGVFLVTLLVALLISARLQRLISEPILQLVQTARAVATGKDYSVRVIKHSADEIGVLIDGFNEMLTQIQARDAALHKTQAELETRVEARTQELASSLSLIRATLESTTDGILVTSGSGQVTSYNEKFIEMWRLPREAVDSKEEQALLEAVFRQLNDPQQFLSQVRNLYADPETESFDLLDFKDGRVFERSSKPQRIAEQIVGRVWSFRDITERRRAEAELAYERDLLRTLLDNSPDQIYFKDAQSRFLKSSKAQAENFGLKSADELVGRTDFDFFAEAHARPAFEDEQEIIRTGRPMIGKVEKEVWNDGRESWVLASKMPLRNKDGEIIGTFGISKDITGIKQAEAKLDQVHKQLLETSRQAGMAEVATSVLHNVGNVLNSVSVSCSLVSEKVRKSRVSNLAKAAALMQEHAQLPGFLATDPKGKQLPGYLGTLAGHLIKEQEEILAELASLRSNIEHIKEIVAMQQSYSKVSGVLQNLPVVELLEDALRMNAGSMDRHGVTVMREYSEVPPVLVDKHKLLQILVNLMRNAKHACDAKGQPDKQMIVRAGMSGQSMVRISVSDNGVGIPPENLTRIFGHGFTTKKDGHGYGLHSGALAAKEMGGSLSAHSEGLGHGATFTLEFPAQPKGKRP